MWIFKQQTAGSRSLRPSWIIGIMTVALICGWGTGTRADTVNIVEIVQNMDFHLADITQNAWDDALNRMVLDQMGLSQIFVYEQNAQDGGSNYLQVNQEGEGNRFFGLQSALDGGVNTGISFQEGRANTTHFFQEAGAGQVNHHISYQHGVGNVRIIIQPAQIQQGAGN